MKLYTRVLHSFPVALSFVVRFWGLFSEMCALWVLCFIPCSFHIPDNHTH